MRNETLAAKALCTRDEFTLYGESRGLRLERLSARELGTRVRRARNLRDKYSGDHRRRRSRGRGKLPQKRSTAPSDLSGTRRKAELFERVLERFSRRADALEAAETRRREEAGRRSAAGEGRRALRTRRRVEAERRDRESHLGRPRGDAGPQAQDPTPKGPGRRAQDARRKGAAGHFGSANRRFQGRRDSRR